MRTIRQLATDEQERYPREAAVLRRDVYMDDVLTGAAIVEEAKELQQQLIKLCTGGLPLRKWSANEASLLTDIPAEHRMQRELRDWRPHETQSTLGLQWHSATDEFSFATHAISVANITKRSVLSLTAKLFNPLGWLAPTTVSAKIAIQSTWLQGLDCDTPIDDASARQWQAFQEELPLLEEIRVPRWIGLTTSSAVVEVHGFADASERTYAAVLYLRTKDNDSWQTILLTAKTKVAPTKQDDFTSPEALCSRSSRTTCYSHQNNARLREVPAALLDGPYCRARLDSRTSNQVENLRCEQDSRDPNQLLWHHISGVDNPADCASRGLTPSELVNHKLWWWGLPWLISESSLWPDSSGPSSDAGLPEERARVHAAGSAPLPVTEPNELLRFSSLHRLL
ncbi:gag-pol polyprotein precursor [Lasius niger]|uniref:Gag-pol polyprotein n=1 Tax=Lasius niger TaxID=67767 RepID=A0A0J7K4Q0_LASNI|nr:gag-pol polyprotein precursor [Lasius niger]